MRYRTSFDFSWPPGDGRLSHAAFPSTALAFGQQPGGAARQPFHQPWPIIAGEKYERFLRQFLAAQRFEQLPDAPIQFFDYISVKTARTGSLEFA